MPASHAISRGRAMAVVAVLALSLAACSAASDVRPFADIQAGEISIAFDPSGTAADLRVDTNIGAVCAVAYGTTEALGMLATDSDMAGGAHTDHGPRLTGLLPDTEYVYRLQGVGEDGRLYRSELMTFRTPEAAPDPGPNAATGATVLEASSEFSDAFAAANAVDGDLSTEWSSRGDGDDAFLTIDLGREVRAVAVGFHSREMTDGTARTTSFTVTVDDGEPLGPFPAGEGLTVAGVEFTGRVVRFDVDTSTGGNTGAVEVGVYQAS